MTILTFFRELYSLDALDTRFTTSSKTPAKVANEESAKSVTKGGKNLAVQSDGLKKPRWNTPEFYFYGFIFITIVPLMYKSVLDVSLESSPHYRNYESLLSPGWLFGRKVDNSDGQYSGFRDNAVSLSLLVILHPLLRRVYNYFVVPATPPRENGMAKDLRNSLDVQSRLAARSNFDFVSAILLISALHGFSAIKILVILSINYKIATGLPRNYIPPATWFFNISILFANELARGYRFTALLGFLGSVSPAVQSLAEFLDSFGGVLPRWEVSFNICVLRLISFNLDHYWSLASDRAGSPIEKKQLDPANLSDRDRVSMPAPSSAYRSFTTYVGYVLYPPLYLAGPILSFNDYISQSTHQAASITTRRTLLYAIRFLITLFCMEFVLHTIYAVAILKSNPDWSTFTAFQLSMLAYFNLHIVWLKLLIPWRFFRLWSLIDGIDPPENMVRCMSDNYSTLAFWRAWHRSYNRWIVRYIYVPLGGTGRQTGKVRGVLNMLAVFTFVALWHDINLRLLMWGWMVVFFVIPEIIATIVFPKSKWKDRPETYRVLCGIGGIFNVLMMMVANLVGFVVGLDGLKGMAAGIIGSWQGLLFLASACGILFVGVQVMFEHREDEYRKGIHMKC